MRTLTRIAAVCVVATLALALSVAAHPGRTDDNRTELPHLKYGRLVEIPSVWGHRAGNPNANAEDAAFVDKQVEALLNE